MSEAVKLTEISSVFPDKSKEEQRKCWKGSTWGFHMLKKLRKEGH